jgi:hypothetical protein
VIERRQQRDRRRPPHCPTCACDKSSPQAVARTSLIPPFRISKDAMLLALLVDPRAFTRLFKFWEATHDHQGQPARLGGEFVSHRRELEIIVRPPPPPPESYRKGRSHRPE